MVELRHWLFILGTGSPLHAERREVALVALATLLAPFVAMLALGGTAYAISRSPLLVPWLEVGAAVVAVQGLSVAFDLARLPKYHREPGPLPWRAGRARATAFFSVALVLTRFNCGTTILFFERLVGLAPAAGAVAAVSAVVYTRAFQGAMWWTVSWIRRGGDAACHRSS